MEMVFDWQGHRGARGLAPENTVPAFLAALEYPIQTLELDVVISRDNQVIISHEPWFSHEICSYPEGRPVPEAEEDSLLILQMTVSEIRQFNCGSRGNASFPEQKRVNAHKPTLAEVVRSVKTYCEENDRSVPGYNIEIKSRPEWDGLKTPRPALFAALVLEEIERLGIADHTCIQSFDFRSLREVKRQAPRLITAMLIGEPSGVESNLEALGYIPEIYSPHYAMVSAHLAEKVHEKGMRLIPWTVNEPEKMKTLIEMGVDGIITDYPNRIPVR